MKDRLIRSCPNCIDELCYSCRKICVKSFFLLASLFCCVLSPLFPLCDNTSLFNSLLFSTEGVELFCSLALNHPISCLPYTDNLPRASSSLLMCSLSY